MVVLLRLDDLKPGYLHFSNLMSSRDKTLATLSAETGNFWVDSSSIPILTKPSSLQFLRDAVGQHRPAILRGLIDEWPARTKWTKDYLIEAFGDKKVSVNLTPDGRADSVKKVQFSDDEVEKDYFVYPAEMHMKLSEFYHAIEHKADDSPACVPYLSQQDDNFRKVCPRELLNDVLFPNPWQDPAIPSQVESEASETLLGIYELAHDAFGSSCGLEAMNLWIGDERSVSSVHKDHFENIYAVISGTKTFTLLPPTDIAFLPEKTFPTLRYEIVDETSCFPPELRLTRNNCPSDTLSWIPLDPADRAAAIEKYPPFALAHPITCEVHAGEVLYIPSMWYHRVSQTELTVAVNIWYDQRFDFRCEVLFASILHHYKMSSNLVVYFLMIM